MDITSEQVCQDLLGLIGKFKSGLARLSESYDLSIMQIHALYAIQQGDVTMGRVASTLHCDASNVTGIVDRLVAGKYITRQEGELDRRTKTLQLTAKGHAAVTDIYSKLPAELGCERLSTSERTRLHEITTKLTEVPTKKLTKLGDLGITGSGDLAPNIDKHLYS
jgi:DNA-binding MarR family transcriptional regulator